MNGTPPTPASGRVRFSFVRSEAMTSTACPEDVYTWLPCQWSQWKCVLTILRTGCFATA